MDLNAYIWSQQCMRLLQIRKDLKIFDSLQAMSLVGLDDKTLWEGAFEKGHSTCDALYAHLIYFLYNIKDQCEREKKVLLGETESNVRLLVLILMTLISYEDKTRQWRKELVSHCIHFSILLGEISMELIKACCRKTIEILTISMENYRTGSEFMVEREVAILSWLVNLYFTILWTSLYL